MLVALSLLHVASAGSPAPAPYRAEDHDVWADHPASRFPLGEYGTGVSIADFDGDGFVDLATSAGNDMAAQHVTVRLHTGQTELDAKASWRRPYPVLPTWMSEEAAFHARSCVGDVDADGDLDLVVTSLWDGSYQTRTGAVRTYLNQDGALASAADPRWFVGAPTPLDCALADFNGDGRVDLAVATLLDADVVVPGPDFPGSPDEAGQALVALLAGASAPVRVWCGTPSGFRACWASDDLDGAGFVVAHDVDQDGFMDLVAAGRTLKVYRGSATGLSTTPTVQSTESYLFPMGLAVADTACGPAAVLSDAMQCGHVGFALSVDAPPRPPAWQSPAFRDPSAALLADVTADGVVDLVTTSVSPTVVACNARPGQPRPPAKDDRPVARLFAGTPTASGETCMRDALSKKATWTSSRAVVGQTIEAVDVVGALAEEDVRLLVPAGHTTIRLDGPRVVAVREVRVGGTALEPTAWSFSPDQPYLQVRPASVDREVVARLARSAPDLDLIIAVWSPDTGTLLYLTEDR